MAEKVDLSLDDIIKMNRKNKPNNKQNKPSKPNLQRLKNLGARSGIVRKSGPKPVTHQRQTSSPQNETTMLHVSNLHFDVSNADVFQLFKEIGPLKKATVHYDKSGRSLGTAEVIYSSRGAAIKAIKKYNSVPLDGRPMQITLVPSSGTITSPAKSRIGVKPGSGIYKRPQSGSKGPNNNNKGNQAKTGRPQTSGRPQTARRSTRQPPKKQVTAEDLDADLEAYAQRMNDS